MTTIFKHLSNKTILIELIPSMGISLAIAEYCYKFGSFTLECLCFLMTWYLISSFIAGIIKFFK